MTSTHGSPSTHILIERHHAGDEQALPELFNRHYEQIFRTLRVRLHGRLPRGYEIEDVVQDAMVAAIEGIDQFVPRTTGAWTAWVVRIARRRLLNRIRDDHADKRRPFAQAESLTTGSGSWRALPASVRGVVSQVIAREDHARIDACVAQLEDKYRIVILQYDYLRRSWPEIATLLGRSVGACQMLHLRARERLAQLLAAKGIQGPADPIDPIGPTAAGDQLP